MKDSKPSGIYGKLPAHGDFIFRNLTPSFVNQWDEWLQLYISASKEQIGDEWLNIYLTSPMWRFVLSSGVLDEKIWAGVIMPSVDRVGRYFPISIVQPISAHYSPVSFLFQQQEWFQQVESFCLAALDGKLDVDGLDASINQIQANSVDSYLATTNLGEPGAFVIGLDETTDSPMQNAMPYLLNATLSNDGSSFSLWQTEGSELIGPLIFCTQGLPPASGIASMLDGEWQQRNWKIPFNLKL
jgi:type VI secretion system protein ImpM